MKKKTFLLSLAIISLLVSCDKDDDKILSNPIEVISENRWRLAEVILDTPVIFGGEEVNDLLADLSPCDRDNLLYFRNDGVLIKDRGIEKCNELEEKERVCGTWEFEGLVLKLFIKGEIEPNILNIECLSEFEMTGSITGEFNDGGGGFITYTGKFKMNRVNC